MGRRLGTSPVNTDSLIHRLTIVRSSPVVQLQTRQITQSSDGRFKKLVEIGAIKIAHRGRLCGGHRQDVRWTGREVGLYPQKHLDALKRSPRVGPERVGSEKVNLLSWKMPFQFYDLMFIEPSLHVGEHPVLTAWSIGYPNPAKRHSINERERFRITGDFHSPMRVRPEGRMPKCDNDASIRIVIPDPLQCATPIQVDGSSFASNDARFAPIKLLMQPAKVRRHPVDVLVVEEMHFLPVRHLNFRMIAKHFIERGRAALLAAHNEEIDSQLRHVPRLDPRHAV